MLNDKSNTTLNPQSRNHFPLLISACRYQAYYFRESPGCPPRVMWKTKTLSAMTSFLNVTGRRGRLARPAYLVSRSSHTSGIRVRDYMCNSQHAAFYHKSSFLLRSVAKTEKACGKMRTTDWCEWIANVTTLKTKTKKRLSVEISS